MTRPRTLAEAKDAYLAIWTIYERPADAPNDYVARLWFGEFASDYAYQVPTLAEARELVHERGGCVLIPRDPTDAPCIVESWI